MNTQELLQKIARYKDALEAETEPDLKQKYKSKIDQLEKQVAEAEIKVEKKEEVLQAKEEKKIDSVEDKIKKFKDAYEAEDDPELKKRYQKKIDELQSQIKDVKEQIKEEKKEIKEQKQEIKEAVREVKSVQKEVRKRAIRKAKETNVVREGVVKKRKKRSKRLETIMSDLEKLIAKNKKIREKYKTESGRTVRVGGRAIDLERDAKRKSKPFGWRFKGKGDYRVPTEAQRRRNPNAVDYEARPNRADVKRKGKVLLEDGGMMMAKGGNVNDRKKDGQRIAKPSGWRWKDEAVEKKLIPKSAMYKTPSKYYREKYPDLVYFENRKDKSDKKPSQKYISL